MPLKELSMSINTLDELYLHEIKDLLDANKQAKPIHQKMLSVASADSLKAALADAVAGIDTGISALEELSKRHDGREANSNSTCKAMQGLVREAEAHCINEEFGDAAVRDASIISQAQRMNHYALAGYGTAAAFAKALGHSDDVAVLRRHLSHIHSGDERLTKIAEGGVNQDAKN
jgi:ferritin-like metal-binding protein YciE